jgi:hypothetical protein
MTLEIIMAGASLDTNLEANVLADPPDLGGSESCSAPELRAILEDFRASTQGFESETIGDLLQYYNMLREDKGLPPFSAETLAERDVTTESVPTPKL